MDRIDFQGISFVFNSPLRTIPIQKLTGIEDRLGFLFPEDYRAFITTLGVGDTQFHLRAYSPQRILDEDLFELRGRLAEFWFWDKTPDILTQAHAVECVPFFASEDGDDIIFHPSNRNCWFLLPHGDEAVIVVRSFRELCAYYLQRYDDLQAPYEFESASDGWA
jgi:hypothetical protein